MSVTLLNEGSVEFCTYHVISLTKIFNVEESLK